MNDTIVKGAPSSALSEGEERAHYVQDMFSRIVPEYDLVNRIQSLGLDQSWRRRTLELLKLPPGGLLLDACCGTGDLALQAQKIAPETRVIGADFCLPMVTEARRKGKNQGARVSWTTGDCLHLPFPDACFDRATVGFGVRNLGDLGAGLRELLRVLKPGGRLAILESSTCVIPGIRWLSEIYLSRVIPLLGRLFSKHGEAYRYLPETILRFPDQKELVGLLEEAGFGEVFFQNQLLGSVAIHVGTRLK
jgi:demethylmenaquinone methyltransferase/2-methoxy-6-polyprenyl-1,4-benzoquinol methylase